MCAAAAKLISIKKSADFAAIFKQNHKYHAKNLIILTKKNSDIEDILRFGIVASKKTGNAVKRNKIKRRLREAVRFVIKNHKIIAKDYVIVAKSGAFFADFEQLKSDLLFCLKGLKTISLENE